MTKSIPQTIITVLTLILCLCSCETNNMIAEMSDIGPSPLHKLDIHFKIDSITEESEYQSTDYNYEMKQSLYSDYPQFFKDSPESFPIKITLKCERQYTASYRKVNPISRVMTLLFLIPPKKELNDRCTHIEISPSKPNDSKMFHIKADHKINVTNYTSLIYPIAWFLRESPAENIEIDHVIVSRPSEAFYRKYLSQKIVSELSKLKLEVLQD